MKIIYVLILASLIVSCNQQKYQESNWELVYKNNAKGEKVYGDKQQLIKAVRNGYPIRIGFGGRGVTDTLKSVEHFVDAGFLTIANGTEVFAQINSIYGQRPYLDADTLSIELRHENKWTLIIGTNGERSTLSRHFNEADTKESRQSNRGCNWYVYNPQAIKDGNPIPIWD